MAPNNVPDVPFPRKGEVLSAFDHEKTAKKIITGKGLDYHEADCKSGNLKVCLISIPEVV